MFRRVLRFKYNNNDFDMFISSNNKHYYLKIINDKYYYPNIKEIIKIEKELYSVRNIMNIERNKVYKIIPKVIAGGTAVTLSLTLAVSSLTHSNNDKSSSADNDFKSYIETSLPFEVSDNDETLEVEYYYTSDWLKYKYIYDKDYLDLYFGDLKVTYDDVINEIYKNNNIPEKYKKLIIHYLDMVKSKYPNADVRTFYKNLKTLKIVECKNERELLGETLSEGACACYNKKDNTIYVLEGKEYVPKTWDYQVIMHELSHAFRTGWWLEDDGTETKVQVEGINVNQITLSEALNSIFTVSLFNYEENDIAYQLQSNIYKIIIECCKNYTVEDYLNHSLSYFAHQLDLQTGYNNYATVIFELIEMQYKDFHSDRIEIAEEEYYPIYDYITELYLQKYFDPAMSYEDGVKLIDELVSRVTYDVSSEYHIDINRFYLFFNEYYNREEIKKDINFKK